MAQITRSQNHELSYLRAGYPSLAAWIARDPDHEAFVFRRFDRLAARNLLHLQSRLITVELEIDQLDEEARLNSDYEARQSSRRWETLVRRAEEGKELEKKRLAKGEELEARIREYHDALLRQAQVVELHEPNERVLSTIREYVRGSTGKVSDEELLPLIGGRAESMLEEDIDLAALRKLPHQDLLSRLLQDHWVFQKRVATDPYDRTRIYKGQHVAWTVAAISTTFSAVLLIGTIAGLYAVQNDKAKLGMVAGFTLLFALGIALMTNARRSEIFAATAAYAAVLVVFISGDLSGSAKSQCIVPLENGIFKMTACPGND
ncbi:MAG: hypothetical protein M1822_002744 [Bathelium mastoideum]|nr:MAG: hypothetical protein M1822_002744 [Bathelium mastoideum]